MTKSVFDIITADQLAALRDAGFVVVHREPTSEMAKSAYALNEFCEPWPASVEHVYHRMVGCSIKQQGKHQTDD